MGVSDYTTQIREMRAAATIATITEVFAAVSGITSRTAANVLREWWGQRTPRAVSSDQ